MKFIILGQYSKNAKPPFSLGRMYFDGVAIVRTEKNVTIDQLSSVSNDIFSACTKMGQICPSANPNLKTHFTFYHNHSGYIC